jgi:hypothetical protein
MLVKLPLKRGLQNSEQDYFPLSVCLPYQVGRQGKESCGSATGTRGSLKGKVVLCLGGISPARNAQNSSCD